jgi:hypothetical protein
LSYLSINRQLALNFVNEKADRKLIIWNES